MAARKENLRVGRRDRDECSNSPGCRERKAQKTSGAGAVKNLKEEKEKAAKADAAARQDEERPCSTCALSRRRY